HAVADIMLANSLLRSMPEVDATRIGLTGISWGGYLTCIVSAVDVRFRFAVPVYGCGFLGHNSTWVGQFQKMGDEKAAKWLNWWDPSRYLGATTMPMLWVDGTNDFAYPLDSLQKSYRLPRGRRTLSVRVRMPHGHGGPGENPEEIRAFADSHLKGGTPLARIIEQGRSDDKTKAWVAYESHLPLVKAELNFTKDAGKWQERRWETIPATIDSANRRVTAQLPDGVTVYYFNLVDKKNWIVSSEHEEILSKNRS
ncbi:MAG: prolyl oligopeptidase family serine peptidase, partial [Armatimonadota bacterium]|nr:prolyl oligopeptidase family serine peptidase [Armatimonadota bacterium]